MHCLRYVRGWAYSESWAAGGPARCAALLEIEAAGWAAWETPRAEVGAGVTIITNVVVEGKRGGKEEVMVLRRPDWQVDAAETVTGPERSFFFFKQKTAYEI